MRVESARARIPGASSWSAILHDVRYGWRSLRREPAFTLFVVVALALGIGLNAVIYDVADRLLFHGPAAISHPSDVVRLYNAARESNGRTDTSAAFDYPAFRAIEQHAHGLAGVAAYAALPGTMGRGRGARPLTAGYVSATFFQTLGVACALGRCLAPIDTTVVSTRPVVLGYGLWQSRFNGQRTILGQTVLIDDQPVVIVGVAPEGFSGAELTRVDAWLPIDVIGARLGSSWRTQWDGPWPMVVARLSHGIQPELAMEEATTLIRHAYAGEDPGSAQTTITNAPLTFNWTGTLSSQAVTTRWLVILAAVVLLLACTNVTNLLLARVSRRRPEIVVRRALGASWGQLFQLFLIEGALLGAAGGTGALVVAAVGRTLVRRVLLSNIVWPSSVFDARTLALCGGLAAAIGVAVGIAPAIRAFEFDVTQGLKANGGNRLTGAPRRGYIGIALQCGLSTVLLVAAGLFVQSMHNIAVIDSGVESQRFVVVSVSWPRIFSPGAMKAELDRRVRFLKAALPRLDASPVVEVASLGTGLPMWFGNSAKKLRLAGKTLDGRPVRTPSYSVVSAGYFETTGTPIERGRSFTAADRPASTPVAVVNDTMARTYWGSVDPIGQCLFIDGSATCTRIVGVAGNTQSPRGGHRPQYFLPLEQTPPGDTPRLFVRTRTEAQADVASATSAIRDSLLSMDPTIDYIDIKSLAQWSDPDLQQWRLGALMFGALGGLALLIGIVGVYSTVFYATERRRREIAIRLAVGASRAHVTGLLTGRTIAAASIGVLGGLGCVWMGRASIEPLLFKTSAHDPAVLVLVATLMILVAVGATLPSVVRSHRINPADALRAD